MDKNVTINFHSMLVRNDGDPDVFGIKNAGELFYTIKVETISPANIAKTVQEIVRPQGRKISVAAPGSITQVIPSVGGLVLPSSPFVLPDGHQVKLSATIQEEDSTSKNDTASNSQNVPTNFIGTAANQVLQINGDGLDIDLNYSVSVTGTTVPGLDGVEMFTSRNFQLSPFGRGFSEIFQAGQYPSLPQQISDGGLGAKLLIGVLDNTISSIRVGKGFTVELFKEANFSTANGTRTLTSSVDDLGPDWNDQISSFIVNRVAPPK